MEHNEDIASLVNRLKSLLTQLTYLKCNIPEDDQVAVLLSALPKVYDNIVTILEEREPEPKLQDVISSLQKEEKKHMGPASSLRGTFVASSSNNIKT